MDLYTASTQSLFYSLLATKEGRGIVETEAGVAVMTLKPSLFLPNPHRLQGGAYSISAPQSPPHSPNPDRRSSPVFLNEARRTSILMRPRCRSFTTYSDGYFFVVSLCGHLVLAWQHPFPAGLRASSRPRHGIIFRFDCYTLVQTHLRAIRNCGNRDRLFR